MRYEKSADHLYYPRIEFKDLDSPLSLVGTRLRILALQDAFLDMIVEAEFPYVQAACQSSSAVTYACLWTREQMAIWLYEVATCYVS